MTAEGRDRIAKQGLDAIDLGLAEARELCKRVVARGGDSPEIASTIIALIVAEAQGQEISTDEYMDRLKPVIRLFMPILADERTGQDK